VSSVFLYLAIVAIWAFVLVPRWLRRQHSTHQIEVDVEVDYRTDSPDAPQQDDAEWENAAEYEDDGEYADDDGYDAGTAQPGASLAGWNSSQSAQMRPSPSRSKVLQARRRLLTMLVLLMVAAAGCTVMKLAAWWVCVPPVGMLGAYLLLLREAALADAEQVRRRAARELRVQAARQRAHREADAQDESPGAQIIDISARVGDQLYDQYADATIRAVGD
jgi:hypothetical protein